MTFSQWPSTGLLGGLALTRSWTLKPLPDLRQTDYDVGPINQRKRQDRVIYEASFAANCSGEEFDAIRTFYVEDLGHGVDKFLMPIWDGEIYSICLVQMAEPFIGRYFAPDMMQITLHFLVHDLPVMDAAAVYMVETYGGDFTIAFANELHPAIHVQYPACFPIPQFSL